MMSLFVIIASFVAGCVVGKSFSSNKLLEDLIKEANDVH
jgi:hypothetical protein